MAGLYFEEFKPGMVIEHAIRRTVTETDNILFSAMTYNCAPLHIDAEYSKNTIYGQRLVNSMFLLALVAGITVYETTLGTTLGNLGFRRDRLSQAHVPRRHDPRRDRDPGDTHLEEPQGFGHRHLQARCQEPARRDRLHGGSHRSDDAAPRRQGLTRTHRSQR